MNANAVGLPDDSIEFARCDITDEPVVPPVASAGVGNLIDADRGVTFDRCTFTAAW